MAIINRTEDPSEQRKVYETAAAATATGVTGILAIIPYPCVVDAGQMVAFGTSGSPNIQLTVQRFIAGTGLSSYILATGTSNLFAAYGTSGAGSFGTSLFGGSAMILPAAGSTLLNLQANDVVMFLIGGTTSAVTGFSAGIVVRPVQDKKVHFGLSV